MDITENGIVHIRQPATAPQPRRVMVFDTTLRDGEQAPGNVMSAEQKVSMFRRLDALGLDLVEGGFPASSGEDFEAFREMARGPRASKICAFCRAAERDIDVIADGLGSSGNAQIEILLVGSEIHLEHKRRITAEEAIEEAVRSVRHAASLGFDDIAVAPEDATRGSLPYLERLLKASVEAGARTVAIPDTVGCALPHEFAALVRAMRSWVGPDVILSAHCHDDMGLALANTLAALEAGADSFQATLCGIGERAGNTALEEAIAQLRLNGPRMGLATDVALEPVIEAAHALRKMIHLPLMPTKPLLGAEARTVTAPTHLGWTRTAEAWPVRPVAAVRPNAVMVGGTPRNAITRRLAEAGVVIDIDKIDAVCDRLAADPTPDRFNDHGALVALYREVADSGTGLPG
ncbi:LeuA family protein [Tistrella mobilis]